MTWIEWFGYAGSAIIALSLMMNNLWRLRWINLMGAAAFTAYGLIVKAYPVVALNAFIVATNIYYIAQMSARKDFFSLLTMGEESELRDKFLEFYREDIARFFPGFRWEEMGGAESVFVLRNLMPVGLFVFKPDADGVAEIKLDYVVPSFRDLKNARYLFSAEAEALRGRGFKTFVSKSGVPAHQKYLRKIGFERDAAEPSLFRKPV